jgi:hypothetical protein
MRIRSVTIGANMSYPLQEEAFRTFQPFQAQARALFAGAGLEVQTVRLATQPFPEILARAGPDRAVAFAQDLEALCQAHGIDYCSVGTVLATDRGADLAYIDAIPEMIRRTGMAFASALVASPEPPRRQERQEYQTGMAFASALVASPARQPLVARHSPGGGIHLAAIARAAAAVADVARTTPNGFGNLRFAVLANCEPGSPFFPAAFHRGPDPTFSIATEAADLAVDCFAGASTLEGAHHSLRRAIEDKAQAIEKVCRRLEEESGLRFGGIDFSLAPYPEFARSIGQAIEELGVDAFGCSSTLFAVALITQVLREASFPRCGFCGLLLPVLEDRTLARRSAEGTFTLDSLLLYSAVCGTGLDTIPLPGDTSAEELAAILLDVATLALAADKPLTARLMPIPGKQAGEVTDFDFEYFANARILGTRGRGGTRLFQNNRFARLSSTVGHACSVTPTSRSRLQRDANQ